MPIQIDMEMPVGCKDCPFMETNYDNDVSWCAVNAANAYTYRASKSWYEGEEPTKRPEWCPLKEDFEK